MRRLQAGSGFERSTPWVMEFFQTRRDVSQIARSNVEVTVRDMESNETNEATHGGERHGRRCYFFKRRISASLLASSMRDISIARIFRLRI